MKLESSGSYEELLEAYSKMRGLSRCVSDALFFWLLNVAPGAHERMLSELMMPEGSPEAPQPVAVSVESTSNLTPIKDPGAKLISPRKIWARRKEHEPKADDADPGGLPDLKNEPMS